MPQKWKQTFNSICTLSFLLAVIITLVDRDRFCNGYVQIWRYHLWKEGKHTHTHTHTHTHKQTHMWKWLSGRLGVSAWPQQLRETTQASKTTSVNAVTHTHVHTAASGCITRCRVNVQLTLMRRRCSYPVAISCLGSQKAYENIHYLQST